MNHVFVNNLARAPKAQTHLFLVVKSALHLETESVIKVRVYLLTSGCCASSLHRLLMRGAKQGKKLVVQGVLCTWGTNHKRNLSSTSSSHWMLKVFCDFKRQSPIHEGKPNGTYLWGEVPHSLRSWLEAFMVLTPLALKRVRELSSRGTHKTTVITWVLMI